MRALNAAVAVIAASTLVAAVPAAQGQDVGARQNEIEPWIDAPSYFGTSISGDGRAEKCVIPCTFTVVPPAEDELTGGPYVVDTTGQLKVTVATNRSLSGRTEFVFPAGQPLIYTATTPGEWTAELLIGPGNRMGENLKTTNFILAVTPGDASTPIDYLSSKRLHFGSIVKVRTPKKRITVKLQGASADVAKSLRKVGCRVKKQDVRCFKVVDRPDGPVYDRLAIVAYNPRKYLADLHRQDQVQDFKLVRGIKFKR